MLTAVKKSCSISLLLNFLFKSKLLYMLENKIIESLLPGPQNTVDLVALISEELQITARAVYKALTKLKKLEIIIVHNHRISLSLVWIEKQKSRFTFADYAYRKSRELSESLVKDKTKISFQFRNYVETDLFWAHVYTILFEKMTTNSSHNFIVPHDFFFYGRNETDAYWIKSFFKKTVKTRFVITHPLSGDTIVVASRRKDLKGIASYMVKANPLHQESNVYYALTGDYIFKAVFDVEVNKKLESFVGKIAKLPLTVGEEKEVGSILEMDGKFTLTIERNRAKATRMEKKLTKYFE